MKKLYCIICDIYRKFEKPKMSYPYKKSLALSIICSKCKNEDQKLYKKRRINWNIKGSWFNWNYIITLKTWLKKK